MCVLHRRHINGFNLQWRISQPPSRDRPRSLLKHRKTHTCIYALRCLLGHGFAFISAPSIHVWISLCWYKMTLQPKLQRKPPGSFNWARYFGDPSFKSAQNSGWFHLFSVSFTHRSLLSVLLCHGTSPYTAAPAGSVRRLLRIETKWNK